MLYWDFGCWKKSILIAETRRLCCSNGIWGSFDIFLVFYVVYG
uniref:Uncharacterized protein n=1 Tax=Arundo donax TaxID=35708 RepID=A0A0A9HSX9_ARUDO